VALPHLNHLWKSHNGFRFFVLGVGMAINLAIGQVFCSNLANNTALLGAFQGAYGIGGIAGPLIATSIVSQGYPWSRFYFIELGLAAFNLIFSAWSFWNYEVESDNEASTLSNNGTASRQHSHKISPRAKSKWNSFKTLVLNKPTVLGACFIFAYQGAEVAISGWIISFLIQFRHGDPSKVGFVTSGFWAGITLGEPDPQFSIHPLI
jgi:fucose permease